MTVIAMTREIGSRGTDVAAGVAAELGLEIINSEIVVPHVAGSLGLEQSAVQRYLDGKASFFDRWQIDTRKLSQHTFGPNSQSGSERQCVDPRLGRRCAISRDPRRHLRAGVRADGTTCARHDGTARCQGCRSDTAGD